MNARILIEHGGKTYRISNSCGCASKRDCSLFKRGVCDRSESCWEDGLPCEELNNSFIAATSMICRFGFKEVTK